MGEDSGGMYEDEIKLPPLSRDEIEVGLLKILEMHPLKRERVSSILPYLCFCCPKRKINMMYDEEHVETGAIDEEIEETDTRLDRLIEKQTEKPYAGSNFKEQQIRGNTYEKSQKV
jgi:hypothetical protein